MVRPDVTLLHGDCLDLLPKVRAGSIDLVLADPPYGTTSCRWDNIIPYEPMWREIWRVLKPNGVCLLFCQEPFASSLIFSSVLEFKYSWIWRKNRATGFQHAKNRPLMLHEQIAVFSRGSMGHVAQVGDRRMPYFPQGTVKRAVPETRTVRSKGKYLGARPNQDGRVYEAMETGYPNSILDFCLEPKYVHPTQKPVDLLEYLIRTYTLPNETVLDFCFGSGSTGVAAINTGRKFVGIEREDLYYWLAEERLEAAMEW